MSDAIIEIPLDDLHDSPTNPRKTFSDAYLQELGANIKAVGRILQPLLVRPRRTALFGDAPDSQIGFEIVFGHCRRHAAPLAGLTSAPCMVRAMTDLEVMVAQVSENLQRKDVHPIEEAQGYQMLIDEHNETPDRLAEQFGKSRSYVYGRLKLLAACPEVRKACLAGEVGAEVALLLSRLRTPKLQQKALGYIKGKYWDLGDGGAKSFRSIRDLLVEHFTLDLNKAPFPIEEEMLLPAAGNCVTCPKRAGNAPEFEDVAAATKERSYSRVNAGADICTDPECFQAKKVAHFKRQAEELAAKGKTVIDGNKARAAVDAHGNVKGAYIAVNQVRAELGEAKKTARAAGGANAPEVVLIQDPRTGKTFEAVKREELKAAGVKVPEPKAGTNANYQAQLQREAAERRKRDEKAAAENKVRWALLHSVRTAAAAQQRNAFDLRLVAYTAYSGVAYQDKETLAQLYNVKDTEALEQRIEQLSVAELTTFLLDCSLIENVRVQPYRLDSKPDALLDAAKHYGVDVEQVRAEVTGGGSTPTSAARAQKEASATQQGAIKYRDAATGSTWSGKGLKPKWLQAALAAGRSLTDFEVPTPSPAARAKGAANAGGVKRINSQPPAGREGKVSVDAGSAGGHDGQAQLELNTAAGEEEEQTVEASSAGQKLPTWPFPSRPPAGYAGHVSASEAPR